MLLSDVIELQAVVAIVAIVARCRSKLVAENGEKNAVNYVIITS